MDFLDFMHVMFDLQKKFPNMSWTAHQAVNGPRVQITLPVDYDTVTMLNDAQRMFEPREDF